MTTFYFWSGFESEAQDHDDEEVRRQYKRHKRKAIEGKDEQEKEVCDTVSMTKISRTEIQRKLIVEFQKEEILAPDTPRDIRENTMVQEISLRDEPPSANNVKNSWRPKTRSKNKLRMNMKEILNPKFRNNIVIFIEDSSSEENV